MFYKKILSLFILLCFSLSLAEEESIFEQLNDSPKNFQSCTPTFVILNKITTKSKKINLLEGETTKFDNLSIKLNKALINKETNQSASLIVALEKKIDNKSIMIFQGWIIHPSHSASTINHPIYEILLVGCK